MICFDIFAQSISITNSNHKLFPESATARSMRYFSVNDFINSSNFVIQKNVVVAKKYLET